MGLLNGLAKVGLVKLDAKKPSADDMSDAEIEALLSDFEKEKPKPRLKKAAVKTAAIGIPKGAPFDEALGPEPEPAAPHREEHDLELHEIYELAEVPESVYPAEKLLKVLEGLAAMDANTKRVVINSLDLADDSWALEDPLRDAARKVQALQASKARLQQSVAAADAQAQKDLKSQDNYLQEATRTLQEQMAELGAQIEAETESVVEEKSQIMSAAATKKAVCQSKQKELDAEISKFQKLGTLFGPQAKQEMK